MDLDKFISELENKFNNKSTWSKSDHSLQESVLNTIKAFILKKDLVLISRLELEKLRKH